MNPITQSEIHKLLDYNAETGKFYWKPRSVDMFSSEHHANKWNGRFAGKEAKKAHGGGYLQICVLFTNYLAHRLAWFYIYGEWPAEIDHINGDRKDNRLVNLRAASRKVNSRNLKQNVRNTSGFRGVRYKKAANRWVAYIGVNGKFKHVGSFETMREAVAARFRAEKQFGYHENHGRQD